MMPGFFRGVLLRLRSRHRWGRERTASSPVVPEMSVRPSLVRTTAVSGQDVGSFGSDAA